MRNVHVVVTRYRTGDEIDSTWSFLHDAEARRTELQMNGEDAYVDTQYVDPV